MSRGTLLKVAHGGQPGYETDRIDAHHRVRQAPGEPNRRLTWPINRAEPDFAGPATAGMRGVG